MQSTSDTFENFETSLQSAGRTKRTMVARPHFEFAGSDLCDDALNGF